MHKLKTEKLNLHRETLRRLEPGRLDRVVGGLTIPFMSCAQLCTTRTGDESSCGPAC